MKSNLAGVERASSDMVDHLAPLRKFAAPSAGSSPGTAEMGGRGSLFTHARNKKAIAEKYPAQDILGIQQALDYEQMGNVFSLPGPETPAGGLSKKKSGMEPLLSLPQSGPSRPGAHRPLRRVSFEDVGGGDAFVSHFIALYYLLATPALSSYGH